MVVQSASRSFLSCLSPMRCICMEVRSMRLEVRQWVMAPTFTYSLSSTRKMARWSLRFLEVMIFLTAQKRMQFLQLTPQPSSQRQKSSREVAKWWCQMTLVIRSSYMRTSRMFLKRIRSRLESTFLLYFWMALALLSSSRLFLENCYITSLGDYLVWRGVKTLGSVVGWRRGLMALGRAREGQQRGLYSWRGRGRKVEGRVG